MNPKYKISLDPDSWELPTISVYDFIPKKDITPIESVWCAAFFVQHPFLGRAEDFVQWDLIARHFVLRE